MWTRIEGLSSQQFALVDGYIISTRDNTVLDVKDGLDKEGNTVWMFSKNETAAQKWKKVETSEDIKQVLVDQNVIEEKEVDVATPALPTSEDLPLPEEVINTKVNGSLPTSNGDLDDAEKDDKLSELPKDKSTKEEAKDSMESGELSSLESTTADGFHFDTPPTVSLDTEYQPCGIDLELTEPGKESGPDSIIMTSNGDIIEETEEVKSSTESSVYKGIIGDVTPHDTNSTSIDVHTSSTDPPYTKDLLVVETTEDQLSSGTFSQDDMSPRYADLPDTLSINKVSSSEKDSAISNEVPSSDAKTNDKKIITKDRSLSMETRSTSITSDMSDQEIPPTTPRSDLSPSTEVVHQDKLEDIMTKSMYLGSATTDSESGVSSDSQPSSLQKIEDMSDTVTDKILDETKSIIKTTKTVIQETTTSVEVVSKEVVSKEEVVTVEKLLNIEDPEIKSRKEVEDVKPTTSKGETDKDNVADVNAASEQASSVAETTKEEAKEDPISDWGKPLGLPSPVMPGTPVRQQSKKDDDPVDTNKLKETVEPVWMDLAYVPHHGNSDYANAEFFKKIRARYYVFSGVEPSKDVFNALLEAKKTWENKEQEVTIIPTYDTDVLGYWVAENEELLTELKIDLAPSASRCTINLQDHETSCAAYRLEF
jgi:hypothetical protein